MIDELERLARNATPGPWEYTTAFGVRSEVSKNEVGEAMPICAETCFDVGEYIAAANPSNILKLIDAIQATIKAFSRCSYDYNTGDRCISYRDFRSIQKALDALKEGE